MLAIARCPCRCSLASRALCASMDGRIWRGISSQALGMRQGLEGTGARAQAGGRERVELAAAQGPSAGFIMRSRHSITKAGGARCPWILAPVQASDQEQPSPTHQSGK